MISQHFFLLVFIFSLSCKSQVENEEIINAKWFYYAYAIDLNGYRSNGIEINPLVCDIKLNSIKHPNADTTKFYFSLYQKDTLNICYLKPLSLVGITAVKNKLYTPIYHSVIFDKETDSLIIEKMNYQSSKLLQRVFEEKRDVSSWLKVEAERRQSK